MRRVTPRRLLALALPTVLVAAACGGNGGEWPHRTPEPAASATAVGYGDVLAWAGDAVLAAESAGDGPSTFEPCPSPQPRFALRALDAGGPAGHGRLVADDPRLFEPVVARVSPDGAHVAVLGFCDQEFAGAVGVVALRGGKDAVRMLPLDRDVSYGNPYLPRTLGWLSATELLAMRTTYTGKEDPDDFLFEAVAVDVRTMRSRVVLTAPDLVAARVAGSGIVALSGRGQQLRVELVGAGGDRTALGISGGAEVAPDAAVVALWDYEEPDDTRLRLRSVAGRDEPVVRLGGGLLSVEWSPRSDRLVAVTEDYVAVSPTASPTASEEPDEEARYRVYVVGADGEGLRELTLPGIGGAVHWSPDGTRLAYTAGRGGDGEVRVVTL